MCVCSLCRFGFTSYIFARSRIGPTRTDDFGYSFPFRYPFVSCAAWVSLRLACFHPLEDFATAYKRFRYRFKVRPVRSVTILLKVNLRLVKPAGKAFAFSRLQAANRTQCFSLIWLSPHSRISATWSSSREYLTSLPSFSPFTSLAERNTLS